MNKTSPAGKRTETDARRRGSLPATGKFPRNAVNTITVQDRQRCQDGQEEGWRREEGRGERAEGKRAREALPESPKWTALRLVTSRRLYAAVEPR